MSCVILFEQNSGFMVFPLLTEQEVTEQIIMNQELVHENRNSESDINLKNWILDINIS